MQLIIMGKMNLQLE